MVGLERGRPTGVVGGKVDEETPAARVNGVRELAELVEGRRLHVELGACGVDAEEVGGGERTPLLPHHAVGDGHGERREGLHDREAHLPHDRVETAHNLAEGSELAHEHSVDRVCATRGGGFDLHVEVASLGPHGRARAGGEEARLGGEHAHLVEAHRAPVRAGARLLHRDVVPRLREGHDPLLGLLDDLAAAHGRRAEVGAQHGAALARRVEGERDDELVAFPAEQVRIGIGCLFQRHRVEYYTTTSPTQDEFLL